MVSHKVMKQHVVLSMCKINDDNWHVLFWQAYILSRPRLASENILPELVDEY